MVGLKGKREKERKGIGMEPVQRKNSLPLGTPITGWAISWDRAGATEARGSSSLRRQTELVPATSLCLAWDTHMPFAWGRTDSGEDCPVSPTRAAVWSGVPVCTGWSLVCRSPTVNPSVRSDSLSFGMPTAGVALAHCVGHSASRLPTPRGRAEIWARPHRPTWLADWCWCLLPAGSQLHLKLICWDENQTTGITK